jgi:PAS domain S-box-containing protein
MFDNFSINIKNYIAPISAIFCLILIRWSNGVLLFHTIAELFSIIVGVLMLVTVWNTRNFTQNYFLVYLGIGYFWISVLDTFHVFTMRGMPFVEVTNIDLTLHIWIYTRFFEAILLLSAVLFLKKKLNSGLMIYFCSAITLIIIWASITKQAPTMLTSEGLTDLKINTEYVIIILLFSSLFLYIKYSDLLSSKVLYYIFTSLVLTIFAELSFTLYTDFNGVPFVIGHLFKFLSFWMIYRAIVQTTLVEPFTVLAQNANDYESIPSPAVIVDRNGVISHANMAAEIFCGKSREQFIQMPIHDLFHPTNVDENDCELCQAINSGRTVINRVELYPETQRSFLISLEPIFIGNKISGMVQSLVDISSRIEIEKELVILKEQSERQEKKYNIITNQSIEGITVADDSGKYTFVNAAFCKMIGYSEEELLTMTVFDVKAPKQDHSSFDKSKTSKEGIPFSVLLQRKDKTVFIAEVIGKRININGTDQVLGTIRDITEKEKDKESLIESEEKWRSLTENSPDHIMLIDRDFIIEFVNQTVSEFSKKQLLGIPLFDCIPPEYHKLATDSFDFVIKYGISSRYEASYLNGEDERRYFDVRISPLIGKDETITGFISTSNDITELKNTETALRQTQKMDAVGQLTGGIAHDFNNILGIVLGNVELLELNKNLDENSLRYIEEIRHSSKRAVELTRQLLGFSRSKPI